MKSLNKISLLVLLLLVLILSGCTNGINEFENDYQMFKGKEHVFVKSNYTDVYNALTVNDGYNIIVFAYDPNIYECPYCTESLPIINEAALEVGIDKILYLDIRTMRVERTTQYLNLINYIKDQVDDLEMRNDNLEIVVPDVYVVKDGEILGHHIGTLKNEEGKFILGLKDDKRDELITIYKNLFNKTKGL